MRSYLVIARVLDRVEIVEGIQPHVRWSWGGAIKQIPLFTLPASLGLMTEAAAQKAAEELLSAPGRLVHATVTEI